MSGTVSVLVVGGPRRHDVLTLVTGLVGLPIDAAFPHPRLSLSHGRGLTVAAASRSPQLAGLGVDMENDRPADPRTARFFLAESEQAWLASLPDRDRRREHVRLWTVKEALFKADPSNAHTVLREYRTLQPAAQCGRARRGHQTFAYTCARLPGAHLTIAVLPHLPRRPAPVPTITFEHVADRIGATLAVPVDQLTPDTTLAELAADSFLLVEMVIDLQEEFDAIFSQAELRQITNLGQLVELLGAQR